MTTNFQEWLDGIELDELEEVSGLFQAVTNCASFGMYEVKPARGGGDRWIVTVPNSTEGLLLASNEAREAFLRHLEKEYGDPELDMESWCSLQHAIAKGD